MKNILILVSLILLSLSILSCGGESTVIYNTPTALVAEDLARLRAKEKDGLTLYKLLDAEKGTYQIPIDSAMVILSSVKASE